MSQDVKESQKSAHLHAVSKPARTSTIRGADPNAKSRVLDPGTGEIPADVFSAPVPNHVMVPVFEVRVTLTSGQYAMVEAWAKVQGWTVEEAFLHYVSEIEAATKLHGLGDDPALVETEPPKAL
jgi:hypothetical protein